MVWGLKGLQDQRRFINRSKIFLSKFKERYPAVFKFLEYQERLA